MSLVTPRKTFVQTGTQDINVQDFSSVAVYLQGTVGGTTTIRLGAAGFSGNFIHGAAQTIPTANTPTVIDVKGAEILQLNLTVTVTGNNGFVVVGQVNKVSNE